MGLFNGIDFSNFPPYFKEDSVREEIIKPLLNALGYSRFDKKNYMVSGCTLEHPYVVIGTKKETITIIPDYIVKVNNINAFIVEAKAPQENIRHGKHVEQAYSYAFHRDVNVERFVLCNGRELTVFNTKEMKLLMEINVGDATKAEWDALFKLLSPAAFEFPGIFNYKTDYGIWCIQTKKPKEMIHYFYDIYVDIVMLRDLRSYTIQATVVMEHNEYYASFDFGLQLYETFLSQIPADKRKTIISALSSQPFLYTADTQNDSFQLSFSAILGTEIFTSSNQYEKYIPFNILSF